MKIGHGRHCLSPRGEFHLIGYRSPNRMEPAAGIHDDIYGNSLLLDQDGKQIFLFSADFLEFEEEMAEDVKTLFNARYGIDRDCVLLSATHNHSSVVSYHKGWYTGKFDLSYYGFLIDTICKAYEECAGNMQEARARYGRAVISGYYGNRNHPGEDADNEVIVVEFFDRSGVAFAGMVNWAVHSTVISANNTWLTGEWAGNVCRKLGEGLGFYPLMMVGAAGDCSNRNQRQGNDFEELERVSAGMAGEIMKIPVQKPLELGEIRCQTLFHTIHHDSFHLDAKAALIQAGKLQLFVFPGELGSKFGIQLKAACPDLGLVCGYTNGYYEYFLPREEYGLSFETAESQIPKGEPEKLIEKFIQASELLKNSFHEKSRQ